MRNKSCQTGWRHTFANKKLINREPCPAKRKHVLSQRTIGRKGEVHSWCSLTLQITKLFPLWPGRSLTRTIHS